MEKNQKISDEMWNEIERIFSSSEWLQYIPKNFLESVSFQPAERVTASQPPQTICLGYIVGQECTEFRSLSDAKSIAFMERAFVTHFDLLDTKIRLRPLAPGNDVEVIIGAQHQNEQLVTRFENVLVQLPREKYQQVLKSETRSLLREKLCSTEDIEDMFANLASISIKKADASITTWVREWMQIISKQTRIPYFAEFGTVPANGCFEIASVHPVILVFCRQES